MRTLSLAFKSIRFRKNSLLLTILSLTLSVVLILSVERVQKSVQENLTQSISQVDLIVGARGSSLSLLLYSVFNIGSASNNITFDSYQKIAKDPRIDWVIPYSLGDGHRGFRVVATDENFFKHYRFKRDRGVEFSQGEYSGKVLDVVIGSEVEKALRYKLKDSVIIAHGSTTGDSFIEHSDRPFTVSGILKPTGTAIDRAIYISLAGMEAIHMEFSDFQKLTSPESQLQPKAITSFFLRSKNRVQTLNLQREINNFEDEPLSAAIPGVVLNDLWQSLKVVDLALRSIIWIVGFVSLAALFSIMLTLLNERRRELSLYRSLGAPSTLIFSLLALEGFLISLIATVLGFAFVWILSFAFEYVLLNQFGFRLSEGLFTAFNLVYSLILMSLATLASSLPAFILYRKSLKAGLSLRN